MDALHGSTRGVRTRKGGVAPVLAPFVLGLPLAVLLVVALCSSPEATLPSAAALSGGVALPVLRSLVAGCAALALTSICAIGLAVLAIGPILNGHLRAVRAIALALALTVTPLLVGPVAFAFLWDDLHLQLLKALLGDQVHSSAGVVVIEVAAQTLRYAPLGAWLLMLATLSLDPDRIAYARASGLERLDLIRTELLTAWSLVLLVVGAFVFQDASNDVILSYLALRPSPASGTELIGHMLSRVFAMLSTGVSAPAATASVLILCIATGILFCVCFVLVALVLERATEPTAAGAIRISGARFTHRVEAWLVAFLCCVVYLPLLWALLTHIPSFGELLSSFGATFLAAFAVSALAWTISAFMVFGLRETAEGPAAARRLGAVGLIAIGSGFFPSIGVALSIYALLFRLPLDGLEVLTWCLAQTIKLMPVLAIFSMPLALGLKDQRLAYGQSAGFPAHTRWLLEFVRPAALAHGAFLLIGWNWVLNEFVISSVFQSDLPAFSELALRATSGRSAAYDVASALVTLQVVLFGALCGVWGEINVRGWWRRHAQHHL